MLQCSDCRTFKKADNCIHCYQDAKERYSVLIGDIADILLTTSYLRVTDSVYARLMREKIIKI